MECRIDYAARCPEKPTGRLNSALESATCRTQPKSFGAGENLAAKTRRVAGLSGDGEPSDNVFWLSDRPPQKRSVQNLTCDSTKLRSVVTDTASVDGVYHGRIGMSNEFGECLAVDASEYPALDERDAAQSVWRHVSESRTQSNAAHGTIESLS